MQIGAKYITNTSLILYKNFNTNIYRQMNYFHRYIIGAGILNASLFNYNMINVDVIRNNEKTKLLPSERFIYSFFAFSYGFIKLPIYIDYVYVGLLRENPETYGFTPFPKKEIDYLNIFKHI